VERHIDSDWKHVFPNLIAQWVFLLIGLASSYFLVKNINLGQLLELHLHLSLLFSPALLLAIYLLALQKTIMLIMKH
jgi:hypothetical protein